MRSKAQVAATKAWLQRYSEAARDSETLDSRVAAMRARIKAPQAPNLDGLPHAPGFEGDSTGAALARLDELEQEAQEARARALALYREIDSAIREISGPGWADRRAVLRVRYLDCESWQVVSEILFGGRGDYEDKQESYLRRVHKIHGAALAKLAEIIPLDEGRKP